MTSPNGNIFRVTGPLWGESPGHRWIPFTKASDTELWCFLWSALEQTIEQTIEKQWFETSSRLLWRHCNVCNIADTGPLRYYSDVPYKKSSTCYNNKNNGDVQAVISFLMNVDFSNLLGTKLLLEKAHVLPIHIIPWPWGGTNWLRSQSRRRTTRFYYTVITAWRRLEQQVFPYLTWMCFMSANENICQCIRHRHFLCHFDRLH